MRNFITSPAAPVAIVALAAGTTVLAQRGG